MLPGHRSAKNATFRVRIPSSGAFNSTVPRNLRALFWGVEKPEKSGLRFSV